MITQPVGPYQTSPLDSTVGNLPSFLESASTSLEALMIEQAQQSKEVARAMRSARREKQRRLVQAQVAKMKEAAEQNIYGVLVGCAAQLGCQLLKSFLPGEECLGKLTGLTKFFAEKAVVTGAAILDGAGVGLASFNWHHWKQADYNARATEHGAAASIQGQLAQEAGEMLQSASQLEQAMLRHLEKLTDGQNSTARAIIDKLGS